MGDLVVRTSDGICSAQRRRAFAAAYVLGDCFGLVVYRC